MSSLDYCIIIFLLVILLLIVAIYAYLLWLNLKEIKQRFASLRKDTDALDLQVEAFKLLIDKYRSSFPVTIHEDIDLECKNASEKSLFAANSQEAFSSSLNEKRWKALREWVNKNF